MSCFQLRIAKQTIFHFESAISYLNQNKILEALLMQRDPLIVIKCARKQFQPPICLRPIMGRVNSVILVIAERE